MLVSMSMPMLTMSRALRRPNGNEVDLARAGELSSSLSSHSAQSWDTAAIDEPTK